MSQIINHHKHALGNKTFPSGISKIEFRTWTRFLISIQCFQYLIEKICIPIVAVYVEARDNTQAENKCTEEYAQFEIVC